MLLDECSTQQHAGCQGYLNAIALYVVVWRGVGGVIAVFALQVLTIKQLALLNVHSYPYLCQIDPMLEALARHRNEPSMQEVLAVAHTVDTKPHWTLLREYHSKLKQNEDHMHEYIPFLTHAVSQNSSGSDGSTGMTLGEKNF